MKKIIKINTDDITNECLREDFTYFIKKTFQTVNVGTKFIDNWHIDLIGEYLKEVHKGNIKRLIVNMPPRNLKSISISVAFPAWILGHNPAARIIVASYSDTLSIKHSTDCRRVVTSKWFQQVFPDFKIHPTQNEKHKFATTQNGYRFATSIGGALTGEGGDYLIIDDPHNPSQVMSKKYRKNVLDWFSNTFSSRLNNKKKGVMIVVMQRLHPEDLTGHLLEKTGKSWTHLSLPAIAEKNKIISIGNFTKNRKRGELLNPNREGQKEIETVKKEMGSYVFSAQYQQNPVLQTASMLKPHWIRRFNPDKMTKKYEKIVLSFDTAIKAGVQNDPTVCTVWGELRKNYYMLYVFREWLEYPDLKKQSLRLIEEWNPNSVLIEDKSSGQSLVQDLKRETKYPIIPVKVSKDKVTRFAAVSAMIEAGRVFLPDEAPWLADFENELYAFPHGKHDDQVDSLTQFLDWSKKRAGMNRGVRITFF